MSSPFQSPAYPTRWWLWSVDWGGDRCHLRLPLEFVFLVDCYCGVLKKHWELLNYAFLKQQEQVGGQQAMLRRWQDDVCSRIDHGQKKCVTMISKHLKFLDVQPWMVLWFQSTLDHRWSFVHMQLDSRKQSFVFESHWAVRIWQIWVFEVCDDGDGLVICVESLRERTEDTNLLKMLLRKL